jgi:hypothetical protein
MLGTSASLPAPLPHTITSGAMGSLPSSGGPTPRGMAAFEAGVRAAGHARRYHVEPPSQAHSAGPSPRTPLPPVPWGAHATHPAAGAIQNGGANGSNSARELTRLSRGQHTSSSQALAPVGADGTPVMEQGPHPGAVGNRLSADDHAAGLAAALQAGVSAAGVDDCDSGYDNGPEALKKMRMRTDGGSAPTARLRSIAQEAVALGPEEEQQQGGSAGARGGPDGYEVVTKEAGIAGYDDVVQQQQQQHGLPARQQWVPTGDEVDGITVVAVTPSGSMAGAAAQAAAAAAVAACPPGTAAPSALGSHSSLPLKASHSLKAATAGPATNVLTTSCSVPAALSGRQLCVPHPGAAGMQHHPLGLQLPEEEEDLERMWNGALGGSAVPLHHPM